MVSRKKITYPFEVAAPAAEPDSSGTLESVLESVGATVGVLGGGVAPVKRAVTPGVPVDNGVAFNERLVVCEDLVRKVRNNTTKRSKAGGKN